MRLALRF